MNIFSFELQKVLTRRYVLLLLIITLVIFPIVIKVIAHLHSTEESAVEGLYAEQVCFLIIGFTQSYFFIPVWIFIFVGQELSSGHVNRIAFAKSRKFYFFSKVAYCAMLTVFFTIIGFIALLISTQTSVFKDLQVPLFTYYQFILLMTISTLLYSLFLLCITFFLRTAMASYVFYLIWQVVDSLGYLLVDRMYGVKLYWLPIHLVKSVYSRNGEGTLTSFYNPFLENPASLVLPILFIVALVAVTYYKFVKSDLATISD